ncbi:MAG: hypothetical protein HY906_01225 [Deltaproteobacteria bacterium]|nr:hypothetical protein [Deltaproteobacteria bacterium]
MRNAARVVRHVLWPLWAVAAVCLAGPAWAACPTGQVACGTGYCIPARQTCCDSVGYPNKYCPAGRACNTDGQTCQGSAMTCLPSYVAAMASCGTEACACTTSCTGNSSCATNCCAPAANSTSGNYCAPSCVCQGSGSLVLYCSSAIIDAGVSDAATWPDSGGGDKDGGSRPSGPTRDPFGPGCSVGGGGPFFATGAGLLLVLLGLGWRRRRARR